MPSLIMLCDVLGSADHEVEKKCKCLQACEDQLATFTPFCVFVDGMLGSEAEFFIKRLGGFLAARWERSYSVVLSYDGIYTLLFNNFFTEQI